MRNYTTFIKALAVGVLLLCLPRAVAVAQKTAGGFKVEIKVTDKAGREPIVMASCVMKPLGAFAGTDAGGVATFANVPKGQYVVNITYVGYVPFATTVNVDKDVVLSVRMEEASLALKEVQVTARQSAAGQSTGYELGRQAIDHLQAVSLADILQLIPGQLMTQTDLTSQSNLQIRTLVNNNTSAFGASIVVDGVPMSNNGDMAQGQFSSTAFVGTDLRNISADDIESVEVITGIPSAEYGDLTSGLLVVNSRVGVTPWQAKVKVNPSTNNYSLGKGFKLGAKAGLMNVNFDYAKAWSDPRYKSHSFDRYTLNLAYRKDFSRSWSTTTKVRYVYAKDWNGNDPDAVQDGTFSRTANSYFTFTHNGRVSPNRLFSRSFTYTVGLSLSNLDSRRSTTVANSTGLIPILTATETGYYSVPYEQASYLASGGTESRPGNLYVKADNSFYLNSGKVTQAFKMGVQYGLDWNNARGYYNDDDRYPLAPNSSGRPRAFYDIPALHQLSAYFQDSFRWNISRHRRLNANLGVRFSSSQPGADVGVYALSPRLNLSLDINRFLTIRGGIGLNSKTPSLAYLYPDKKYNDRVAANYMPQDDEAARLLAYHTQVYDVKKSEGIKNATTRKIELGLDVKLPGGRKLSLTAYEDRTKNGFSSATEWATYTAGYYTTAQGLITSAGNATTIDFANPARIDTVFLTTGRIGNFAVSVNKGVEMNFELGRVEAINTAFTLTGAYQETKTYNTDLNTASPTSLPTVYTTNNTVPFKLVYPSGVDKNIYRQFSNGMSVVTNIPALRMVVSLRGQAIWYSYSDSRSPSTLDPIGWIDRSLVYHEITPSMLADASYTIEGVSLAAQRKTRSDSTPTKNPITWLVSGRVSKEFGNYGGISFYVNNLLYYEPYMSSSSSATLTQRNTGNFSFGVELFLNL